jgi:hypothetical protein
MRLVERTAEFGNVRANYPNWKSFATARGRASRVELKRAHFASFLSGLSARVAKLAEIPLRLQFPRPKSEW